MFVAGPLKTAVLAGCTAALLTAAVALRVPRLQAQGAPAADTVQYYQTRVAPIFKTNCYRCHGGLNHRGGLQIDRREGLMKGGKDGAVLVPGHPDQSLLIKLIRHQGPPDDPMPMPPKSKLSDADVATVTAWVAAGAKMP